MKKISIIMVLIFANLFCSTEDENTAKMSFPEVMSLLGPEGSLAFFWTRDIDTSLTPNCGVATPGTTSGTTGTGGTTVPPTGGTTGTSTSKRIILSQLVFETGETLTLKFQYDSNQYQGALDQQQGFMLTGGIFGHTVNGRQGTVKWNGQGIGYIDESNNSAQTLTYMIVSLNLKGTFIQGTTSIGTTPFECNTSDNVNCTSTSTTTKCFTQDGAKCVNSLTQAGTQVSVTIAGDINCNAANVIPQ
ncbi:MAG: hypothetical protein KBA66_13595 [Leptospiraceae bacterium]|nr:hypothetical protein [Leptospiraceae bacterium]